MTPTRPPTRVYVTTPLCAGARVALGAEQAHHLRNVLRLAPGAAVALFNGRDGEWAAEIKNLGKAGGFAEALLLRRPQGAEADLWLGVAALKRAPIDYLIEKATELGASRILPVVTERTQAERLNLARLRAHALAAAQQSERLTVPIVEDLQPLSALVAAWPGGRRLLLCDESGTAPPVAEVLSALPPSRWGLLVGPEGGFTQTELDALRKLPFVSPIGLGPRVLRADTAALAALAVLQALRGDWGGARKI